MSFFYPEQLYPEDDPFAAAQAMGLPLGQAMSGGQQFPDYDLNMLAEQLGIQYNPYQGYPNKIVPDQVMDIYGPTPDYLLPQLYNIQNPDAGGFDLDAFFQANPTIQGPLAEAYTQAEGDPIKMYSQLQNNQPVESVNSKGESVMQPGIQDRLRQEVGREEWAGLAEQGYKPIIRAVNQGASPEELDDIAMDYYMKGLEDVLAAGSPTTQRAEAQLDYTRQREGFRPGPGTGQEYPSFEGPGFGQPGMGASGGGTGTDPLAALAQSPQYGGGGEGLSIGGRQFQVARETPEGVYVRPGGGGDMSGPGRRAAQLLRSGRYLNTPGRRQSSGGGGGGRNPGMVGRLGQNADQLSRRGPGSGISRRIMSWFTPSF